MTQTVKANELFSPAGLASQVLSAFASVLFSQGDHDKNKVFQICIIPATVLPHTFSSTFLWF